MEALNGDYQFNGRLVHGRPMFELLNGYGIWFNGESGEDWGGWVIGSSTNVDEGEFKLGFVNSNTITVCPEFGLTAKEWWNNQWSLIETETDSTETATDSTEPETYSTETGKTRLAAKELFCSLLFITCDRLEKLCH